MSASQKLDFEALLNPEQLAAVTHGEGPQLVLAGAGSGKTRVITYRIAWLVGERGVDPAAITAVTFTNKAAREMAERVEGLLGLYPLPTFVGTFHRFALRLLRAYGERVDLKRDFTILDGADQLALVKRALKDEELPETSFDPRAVLASISAAKNRLLTAAEYERQAEGFYRLRVARVYRRYQARLQEAGGIDFDDMIRLSVKLLGEHPEVAERIRRRNEHLLVDEFQDTNHAQLALVHALVGSAGNLTAVGDEDQGIYRWRGAELDNILRFEDSFPGAVVRKLERNYRSTQTILDAAGSLVAHNRSRRGKRLWTEDGAGDELVVFRARDELDEARWIVERLEELQAEHDLGRLAVLVRTNAQTRVLEDELLRRRLPYTLVGGQRFYERAEVKDLIAYLRLVHNPRDTLSFNRVVNRPPRGIGRATHEQLLERAAERRMTPWDVLAEDDLAGFAPRAAGALRGFRRLLEGLVQEGGQLPLPALLRHLLEATSYADLYRDKDDAESRGRLENVDELLSAAQEFTEAHAYGSGVEDLLLAFLDHLSLASDLDGPAGAGGISLMTLHSAKGLEFRAVFLAGLEEGLLPHFNAMTTEEGVEEERRLLYVGMTRAERRLFLSHSRRRRVAGRYQERLPSPFLDEIPERHLRVEESPFLGADTGPSANVQAFFGHRSPATRTTGPRSRTVHPEPDAGGIRKGSRVRHTQLGRGVVLQMEGSGDDLRLVVFFDGHGKRKLMARYANLEIV